MFNVTLTYQDGAQFRFTVDSESDLKDFLRDASRSTCYPDEAGAFTFTGLLFSSIGLRAVAYAAMPSA